MDQHQKSVVSIFLLCSHFGGPGEHAGAFVMMYAMTSEIYLL
jgi:hypothetical protein